jgi:hypothetical protein
MSPRVFMAALAQDTCNGSKDRSLALIVTHYAGRSTPHRRAWRVTTRSRPCLI